AGGIQIGRKMAGSSTEIDGQAGLAVGQKVYDLTLVCGAEPVIQLRLIRIEDQSIALPRLTGQNRGNGTTCGHEIVPRGWGASIAGASPESMARACDTSASI